MKKLLLIIPIWILFLVPFVANADVIAQWALSSTTTTATTNGENVTNSSITLSSGTLQYVNNPSSIYGASWPASFSTSGKYFQFSMSVNSGKQALLSSVTLDAGRTTSGPANFRVQYSMDNFATAGIDVGIFTNWNTSALTTCELIGLPSSNISGTITFRVWGYNDGENTASGNFMLNNITINGVTSTLPVSLTSFTAKANLQNIDLAWATASEKNNSHFDVLRSGDGKTFTKIDEVKGAGTTDATNNYTFTDKNALPGVSYYQLKQVDFNGNATLSKVEAVKSNVAASNFKVTTNQQEGTVKLTIYAANEGKATFKIYNLNGRKLTEQELTLSKGYSNLSVPFNGANGLHVATLTTATETVTQKFIQ